MVRTPTFDKNGTKKGAWSPEEDNRLRAYIQRYGVWNWRQLPKYAGLSRCGKSCRLRWINYLCPNVKRGNFTKEEDNIIMELHEQLGNKWSTMAKKLPGRTDNELKNHWHTHLKKHKERKQPISEGSQEVTENSQTESNTKEQFIGRSQCREANQKTNDVAPGHPILESSPFSPKPCCSDCGFLGDLNWVVEDSISSLKTFVEPIGNIWTEPFLANSSYNRNEFSSSTMMEGGFMSPYHSYYDDGSDFFYSHP